MRPVHHHHGLSAGAWTNNLIFKMANPAVAGRTVIIWANADNKLDPTSPRGGRKESGFGREGGLQGLAAYCEVD